ncbi:spondin domain-containing protein [Nonomuraea sp. NBC_00507]|uniref:spondin domain-containing protein n=1 Tax=Nonomuraea sp. NBC_00507 TaxID=2976002 RepID=UPI002E16EA82
MRPVQLFAGLTALCAGMVALPAAAQAKPMTTWTVKIQNLTPPGSQPLSPPVVVVHSPSVHVWQLGRFASRGVAAVAEDGDAPTLIKEISKRPGVRDAFAPASAPIAPGQSATFQVKVRPGDRISVVSMLVNTNDGFTGVDALRPRPGSIRTMAYDAGSEKNLETKATIPGPCCGNPMVRAPERRPISKHKGIMACGDLDRETYGWTGPVAKLTFAN